MGQLAVTAVVQIGVGLLLNFIFKPKGANVSQEGPRLGDLSTTSSAYGQPINIAFGTFRMSGNVIWSPGLQEVPNTSSQESGAGKGGGGGGSVSTTTYSYFASFQVGFAEGIGENVLQIFADGKLILDRLNTTAHFSTAGLDFRFYPGNETQLPDALIEADKGVGNVPANRGLCNIVFDFMPLVNYGNRIPNITSVITYNQNISLPFQPYTLLAGASIPGSISGGDQSSNMMIDFFSDQVYFFKNASGGLSRTGVNDRTMKVFSTKSGIQNEPLVLGADGFIYGQFGASNFQTVEKLDPITMLNVATFGTSAPLGGPYPNGSFFGIKRLDFSEFGIPVVDVLVTSRRSAVSTGGIRLDQIIGTTAVLIIEDFDVDIGRGGGVIQDFVSGRVFVLQESNAQVDLYEIEGTIEFGIDIFGNTEPKAVAEIVFRNTFLKGGTDLPGTDDVRGWCTLPEAGAIIISNDDGMLKFDMNSGNILAKNLAQGFVSRNNFSITNLFAFPQTAGSDCDLITISTDDLTVIRSERISTLVPGLAENSCYERAAYDYRNHSIIFSRVNGASVAVDPVVRVFLNRATGEGVSLADVNTNIATRIGLTASDIDFSAIALDTVQGYVITQQSPARNSVDPLQQAFLYDLIESDFKVKAVKRGGSPVLTIEEDEVGRLNVGDQEEFIKELRIQEVELPLRMNVRFADKEKDYQQAVQFDKRIGNVTPTTQSKVEQTLDFPLVLSDTEAKQLAQRWLYTIWQERLSFNSQLPWKFIRLDPTDIATFLYRGDIRTIRMSQIEIGADLTLDFAATQEDARTNDSDVIGDGGSGFIPQLIPSTLPTKLLPLDIPLLFETDASFQTFVRAYFAVAGYDVTQTFPGAILFNSRDSGGTFTEIASAPFESSWGTIDGTIPDPIQTFTWDDTTVISLKVARGIANLISRTDLEILNGANAIAVTGASGPEIIQFVNVVQIDISTVQISRLLRGRRGTEDVAINHGVAETWTLLEIGNIYTFQVPLSLRNLSIPYRAVTLNTQLEDAQIILATYTGQDLLPYSVANIQSSRDNVAGALSISWLRRTRFGGELRDGTGEVPLNETLEQFEIEFYATNNPIIPLGSIFVNDAEDTIITQADIDAAIAAKGNSRLISNQIPVVNWEFEEGGASSVPGWSGNISSGDGRNFFVRDNQTGTSITLSAPAVGTFGTKWVGNSSNLSTTPTTRVVTQTLDLLSLGYDAIYLDSGETIRLDVQIGVTDVNDSCEVFIEVRDALLVVIQTITTGKITTPAGWTNETVNAVLAVGARSILVTCRTDKESASVFDPAEGAFDEVKITLGDTTIAPYDVKIYQISGVVGRGRATLQRI